MRRTALCILLCSSTMLGGCNWVIDHYNETYSQVITANKLDTQFEFAIAGQGLRLVTPWNVPRGYEKPYVARVALDSIAKCHKLLMDTGLLTRGIDSNFDILTTVLSALATAFTPVGTIHALTAAASISSGLKGVANTDLFGKQTAPIIVVEITSTYFAEMKKYVADLSKRSNGQIVPAIEVLNITFIHQECDIDKAIGDLNAKARNVETKTPVAVPADIKAGYLFPDKQSGKIWKVIGVSGTQVTIQEANGKYSDSRSMDQIMFMINGSI